MIINNLHGQANVYTDDGLILILHIPLNGRESVCIEDKKIIYMLDCLITNPNDLKIYECDVIFPNAYFSTDFELEAGSNITCNIRINAMPDVRYNRYYEVVVK